MSRMAPVDESGAVAPTLNEDLQLTDRRARSIRESVPNCSLGRESREASGISSVCDGET